MDLDPDVLLKTALLGVVIGFIIVLLGFLLMNMAVVGAAVVVLIFSMIIAAVGMALGILDDLFGIF